jgi:hypothetical protein
MNNTRAWIAGAIFFGCIVGANWALSRFGFVALLGVGPMVPAGVYFAGLAFGARDALHEAGGRRVVVTAILAGAALSWFIEPTFAVASGAAFLVSEFADFAVYEPLRRRRWVAAVAASNVVGSVIDSLLFLWIAFGATAGWFDLTVGKVLMIVPAVLIVWVARRK